MQCNALNGLLYFCICLFLLFCYTHCIFLIGQVTSPLSQNWMRSDREKRHSTYKTPSIYLMANFSRQYFQTPPCCMHSRGICEGICEMHFLEKWRWPIHFRDCKSVHVTNEICRFWGCIFWGVYQSAYGASLLLKEKNASGVKKCFLPK
jgi:hypothetical protein